MEFFIDEEKVEAVLLADGWHQVKSGSFQAGRCLFVKSDMTNHFNGYAWIEGEGVSVFCPVAAVLGIRYVGMRSFDAANLMGQLGAPALESYRPAHSPSDRTTGEIS